MPMFLSTHARQSLVYRHGDFTSKKGMFGVDQPVVIPTLKAQFTPLTPPISTKLVPGKNGLARGILDTKQVTKQFLADAQAFGEEVPTHEEVEGEILRWLRGHSANGSRFAEVPEAVANAAGMPEEITPVDSESVEVFQETTGGRLFCTLCEVTLKDSRGRNGHENSKVHMEKVREFDRARRERLGQGH